LFDRPQTSHEPRPRVEFVTIEQINVRLLTAIAKEKCGCAWNQSVSVLVNQSLERDCLPDMINLAFQVEYLANMTQENRSCLDDERLVSGRLFLSDELRKLINKLGSLMVTHSAAAYCDLQSSLGGTVLLYRRSAFVLDILSRCRGDKSVLYASITSASIRCGDSLVSASLSPPPSPFGVNVNDSLGTFLHHQHSFLQAAMQFDRYDDLLDAIEVCISLIHLLAASTIPASCSTVFVSRTEIDTILVLSSALLRLAPSGPMKQFLQYGRQRLTKAMKLRFTHLIKNYR
jgi:hypothetical protein